MRIAVSGWTPRLWLFIRFRLVVLKAMTFVMGIVSYLVNYESIENARRKNIQIQVSYITLITIMFKLHVVLTLDPSASEQATKDEKHDMPDRAGFRQIHIHIITMRCVQNTSRSREGGVT